MHRAAAAAPVFSTGRQERGRSSSWTIASASRSGSRVSEIELGPRLDPIVRETPRHMKGLLEMVAERVPDSSGTIFVAKTSALCPSGPR